MALRASYVSQTHTYVYGKNLVGMPRIELGPYAPHAYTLPLCYTPRIRREYTIVSLW